MIRTRPATGAELYTALAMVSYIEPSFFSFSVSYHQRTGIDDFDLRRGCGVIQVLATTMKIPYWATSSAPKGDRPILEYTTKWSSPD